ncbi:MAG TPA: ribosome-associated translation inhibitor RaiA [Candidatus Saccharimonadia bacterium]|nr:ribosome-associated translation inhibitor RaiA [Candidatus Saccharimonadia bacterium]
MIKLNIATRNFEADTKLKDYIEEKIGSLDKFLPRSVRGLAEGKIVLETDPNGREDNRLVCEAILTIGGTTLVCREGAINMYASVDIVVAKLKAQICTYKEKHVKGPRRLRMLSRWFGRTQESDLGTSEPTL